MTGKCKKSEADYQRRSFEGPALLTREVRRITRPILGTRGFAEVDILEAWDDIVGADLARGITPERLTFERDSRVKGTLHVKSAGGAFAMLFEHQKMRVIERINSFFGYPAVARIKIMQGALKLKRPTQKPVRALSRAEQRELAEKVAVIEDDELRRKAYEIGVVVAQKKEN